MVHGRQISVEETLAGIDSVTVDDCGRLAREFFVSEKLAFVALGDLKNLDLDRDELSISE
jgi:predicted Zn-dependent peptidase